jgi:hypothetical protein
MRTVHPTSEIPHLWIHQTQTEAKNPGHNLYFTGTTIYSYGSHFPMADIVERKGKRAVMFTTRTYSVTTAKHLSQTKRAVPAGMQVFEVSDIFARKVDEHKKNLEGYRRRINEFALKSLRARTTFNKEWKHKEALALAAEASLYAVFFNLRFKPPTVPALDSKLLWDMKAKEDAKRKAQNEAARERRRLADEENLKQFIERFRNGETVYGGGYGAPTMLRLEGEEVVTSRGARVPASHAKRAIKFVRTVMESGQEWQRNGHTFHIGPYSLDKVTATGTVHAGCHVIEWAEIERLAPALEGVAEAE